MTPAVTLEERRLAFEARRVSIETLIKIYVEQMQGARHLVLTHLRLMFALGLGALAGVITLYAAMLRFGPAIESLEPHILQVVLALSSLAAMIASALLTAFALQRTADSAVLYLQDPFPNSGPEIDAIFHADTHNEIEILHNLYRTVENGLSIQPKLQLATRLSTILLIIGLFAAGASFLV